MGMNDWPHSCSGFLFKNGERTSLNSSCRHTKRGIFCISAYENIMQVNSISKELIWLYDHMAFFLMQIGGTEKTPAPAMQSRASILTADYLIAVSEGKLFQLSAGLTGQLCLYAVLKKRDFLLKVMSVVHVAWDSVYF